MKCPEVDKILHGRFYVFTDPLSVTYRQRDYANYRLLEIFTDRKICLVTCLPRGDGSEPLPAVILLNVKRNTVKLTFDYRKGKLTLNFG